MHDFSAGVSVWYCVKRTRLSSLPTVALLVTYLVASLVFGLRTWFKSHTNRSNVAARVNTWTSPRFKHQNEDRGESTVGDAWRFPSCSILFTPFGFANGSRPTLWLQTWREATGRLFGKHLLCTDLHHPHLHPTHPAALSVGTDHLL